MTVVVVLALALAGGLAQTPQPPTSTAAPDALAHRPRGWAITYADGRTVTNVLSAKGGMWTPQFPRVAEATPQQADRAHYLDISYVTEGDDVIATVAVASTGFRERVTVATVRVRPGHPLRVEKLRRLGVEPVTLAIVSLDPALLYPALVTEPSGQLVVRAEPAEPDVPLYSVSVLNQSARAVRAIQFEAFAGDTQIMSGRRKTERNEPLILPGQEYTFQLSLSHTEGKPWRAIDRLVFTSVMWEDGTVDGDAAPAEFERVLAGSRAARLQRLIRELTSADPSDTGALRAAFLPLDRSDIAMEHTRAEALAAIDRLEHERDPAARRAWLAARVAEYRSWLSRLEEQLR